MPLPLGRRVGRWLRSLVVPLVVFLFLRTFLVETFHIYPSGSMERTLLIGDFLFANKALYGAEIPFTGKRLPGLREPSFTDIVVFSSVDEPDLTVVKRVIGVPGDTLEMRAGELWRNGIRQMEPYAISVDPDADPIDPRMRLWQLDHLVGADPGRYRPSLKHWGPLVVPSDSFFVMGDNRDASYDSRYWGFLGRDRIKASPFLIYFSFDRKGQLPLPFLTAIRWRRLFSSPD